MTFIPIKKLLAALTGTTAMLLAACGGGGSDGSDDNNTAQKPSAVIKADATTVSMGTTVTLDGSASTSPNNGTLNYQWALLNKPAGSHADLSGQNSATSSFLADQPGEYQATLIVNDGTAGSDAANLTITATNPNPVAIIDPAEQTVLQGSVVRLNGEKSLAPHGENHNGLQYQWTIVEQPQGTPQTILSDPNSRETSFFAEKNGAYRVSLTVTHGQRTSTTVETLIKVNNGNSAPVAVLNVPETAFIGDTITLDGSGSHDPDGDELKYHWIIPNSVANVTSSAWPAGSTAKILDANKSIAQLSPDVVGIYNIVFYVYDDSVMSSKEVAIKVSQRSGDTTNHAPVARINAGNSYECEEGGPYPNYQICAVSNTSYDIDGDPLNYRWRYWNTATPGDIFLSTDPSIYISSASQSTWEIELQVNDGKLDSAVDRKTLIIKPAANVAPEAIAQTEFSKILINDTAELDGSQSRDKNGDQLTYLWTLALKPDDSTAELQDANKKVAKLKADKPGLYIADLQVSDGKLTSKESSNSRISIFAKKKNHAPIITQWGIGSDGTTTVGGTPIADGQAVLLVNDAKAISAIFHAVDPDNDSPLMGLATVTKRPEGSKILLSQSDRNTPINGLVNFGNHTNFIADKPGDYEMEFIVSDDIDNSDTKRLVFQTVANKSSYPSLLLQRLTTRFGMTQETQIFFPQKPNRDLAQLLTQSSSLDNYRLTAVDQDYTITDVVNQSNTSGLQAKLMGIEEGLIIKKGDSLDFSLVRPTLDNEPAIIAALRSSDTAERDAQLAILKEYKFLTSFKIKERAGFEFRIGINQ
ncbi:PKD domain-containing protein [Kerstersia gyiorum]|uniref:PKD domain-containing protein n=1 Tax=Kerstersia gyiorum TaxID=206506 RepID=UPI0021503799|nr:PKD domain-containing protein [Kerstersia gyiorum]MCR4157901.1 PKD domain-containing protein [Kerstersia gyiorum]